ncbi:MAG: HEAT repeat domain-containing protein [Planctomycetes bacterium]|nr:HEAT repeat domain-containing protein [Planctomycetota bacterium]
MKYLLVIAIGIITFFILINIAQGHGGGPHGGNPIPPPPPPDSIPLPTDPNNPGTGQPPQPGKPPPSRSAPPPFISTEGITYDFLGGLIRPVIKEKITETGTASVNLLDPALIGIEMLNSYFIPFDTYQVSSLSGVTVPAPSKKEIFIPGVPLVFRLHLIVSILQTMSYIEICPESSCAEYLIEISQPSLMAAKTTYELPGALIGAWLRDKAIGKRVAAHVMEAIGDPAPQPPPVEIAGAAISDTNNSSPNNSGTSSYNGNHFETMINRLMTEELGKEYYFPGCDLGRRLRELGPEVLPYIINAAKNSQHSLLRRNAVALLGYYNTPEASNALRDLFVSNIEKDKVIRNRALSALVNRRDVKIVPALIDILKNSKDNYFKTMAAYSLGLLGDKQAIKPLMDYMESDPNNRDVLWAVIQSLGLLCNETNEDVKKYLNGIIYKKLAVTRYFAWIALYSMGDKSAADNLELKTSKNQLQKLQYPVLYFAIRVFSKMGDDGAPILLSIITNRLYDTKVRFAAITQMKFTPKHIDVLKELVANPETPSILKAYGLYTLYVLKDKDMIADTEVVIKDSLKDLTRKGVRIDGEGFDTVVGMRILGLLNANKEPVLQEAINKYLESIKLRLPPDRDNGLLLAKPPVIETAIEQLGLIRTEEASKILLEVAKQGNPHFRGKAILTLADLPPKKHVVKTMIEMLSDEDGWTRYCAYCALKRVTGQDFNCEWMYDSDTVRKETAALWKKWWAEGGSDKYK